MLLNIEGKGLIENGELLKDYFFYLWPIHDIPITICNLRFMLNNTSHVFWSIVTMIVIDMIIIQSINILMSTWLRGFNFSYCLYKRSILMIPLKKTWFHAHMFFTKQILPLKQQLQNRLFLALMTTRLFFSWNHVKWLFCKKTKTPKQIIPLIIDNFIAENIDINMCSKFQP